MGRLVRHSHWTQRSGWPLAVCPGQWFFTGYFNDELHVECWLMSQETLIQWSITYCLHRGGFTDCRGWITNERTALVVWSISFQAQLSRKGIPIMDQQICEVDVWAKVWYKWKSLHYWYMTAPSMCIHSKITFIDGIALGFNKSQFKKHFNIFPWHLRLQVK